MPSKVPEFSIWKQILRILNTVVLLNLFKKKHGEYLPLKEFCSVWVLTSVQGSTLLSLHSLVPLSSFHKVVWRNSWKQWCWSWFHAVRIYSFMCGLKWVSLDRIENVYFLVIQIKSVFFLKKEEISLLNLKTRSNDLLYFEVVRNHVRKIF